jgi:hypothetical protein
LVGCNNLDRVEGSSSDTDRIFKQSPIGDNVHCEVYEFIKDYLLHSNKKSHDIHKMVQSEMELLHSGREYKGYMGDVGETEMSHILYALRNAHDGCYKIDLYSRDGVCIASSCFKDEVEFNESNVYEELGFLYPNPEQRIRIEKLILKKHGPGQFEKNATYYKVVRAIYCTDDEWNAYFLQTRRAKDHIIGYISYIIKK